MRPVHRFALAIAALVLVPAVTVAQGMGDSVRSVADGGIKVAGWQGTVDPTEASRGQVLANAKLASQGNGLRVTTGPAVTYWNPANRATGDYTVKATFTEENFMGLNDHAHPYGIVIGGNDMGTPNESYLYCAAYGNGGYIVRGFGPAAFQMSGRRATPHPAVNKAAAKGSSVTQEIAVSVKGDQVSCAINGQVVATYPKADLVTAGKLKSTDGIYGIRFGHNTDAVVTGLTVAKQ